MAIKDGSKVRRKKDGSTGRVGTVSKAGAAAASFTMNNPDWTPETVFVIWRGDDLGWYNVSELEEVTTGKITSVEAHECIFVKYDHPNVPEEWKDNGFYYRRWGDGTWEYFTVEGIWVTDSNSAEIENQYQEFLISNAPTHRP